MRRFVSLASASALLALAACSGGSSSSSDQAGASPTPAPTTESGPSLASAPASFAQCSSCHTIKPGVHAVGPSLFAIYGEKAGDVAGYSFSPAMKASGKVWDDAGLDAYLTSPMKDIPGTKMTFAGVSDPAKRKEIIGFLKTLK